MKPHRGITIVSALLCASCQVQQYIDNEDLRIYNTHFGKTKLAEPACTPAATPEQQTCTPAGAPAAPATPAPATTAPPLPPSIQSGSDWTEETPGSL